MKATLTGTVRTWKLNGHVRKFAEVTLSFREASVLFLPEVFDALKNSGEQREVNRAHVGKLKRAMETGEYTPTPAAVGLRKEHQKGLKFQNQPDGTELFSLEVDSSSPLPLTDAGHRMAALKMLSEEAADQLKKAKKAPAKAAAEQQVEDILNLPITCTVYLDGESRRDFVNLQSGRAVDPSHLFSLKVRQKVFSDRVYTVAFDVAKRLHKDNESPFEKSIRFDSRGALPLPVNTLCGGGSSDIATSLLGLAKVGSGRFDGEALAGFVTTVYQALKTRAPELLTYGKVLTPLCADGTKGSATMLIGLAVCLAHRVGTLDQQSADETLVSDLVRAAKETLDEPVNNEFSGPFKRKRMGLFAKKFFADDATPKHEGVPAALLKTLSASAFGVSPLPKEPRPARAKVVTTKKTVAPAAENVTGAEVLAV